MKECPECGSVLADNEPYCENCGYDPNFDSGGWRSSAYSGKTYARAEDPDPYVLGKAADSIICIGAFLLLLFVILVGYIL